MKNIITLLFVSFLLSAFYSCDNASKKETNDDKKEFKLIHIAWDNGWKKPACNGFGMCKVEICGFCCFDANGVKVPCKDEKKGTGISNSGQIKLNIETGKASMVFFLDPNDPVHKEAISNENIFRINENLEVEGINILKGEYKFNPEIGSHGGYKILAEKK